MPDGRPAVRRPPTRSPVIIHDTPRLPPKSPATTSDTLSSSTSALHITSRRYELRELALLLGMCGQLVHQTFINCEGHFFFFIFARSWHPVGKRKNMLLVTSFLA